MRHAQNLYELFVDCKGQTMNGSVPNPGRTRVKTARDFSAYEVNFGCPLLPEKSSRGHAICPYGQIGVATGQSGTFRGKGTMGKTEMLEPGGIDRWLSETRKRLLAPASVELERKAHRPPGDLLGSIVFQPALNEKRSIRFLSGRRWRASTKERDLGLLKKAKETGDGELIRATAGELAEEVTRELIQSVQGLLVTNPPPGATEPGKKHFATEIAGRLLAS